MTPKDYIDQAERAERLAGALLPGPDQTALRQYAARLRADAARLQGRLPENEEK